MKKRYESPLIVVFEMAPSAPLLSSGTDNLPSNYDQIPFTDEECDDPA